MVCDVISLVPDLSLKRKTCSQFIIMLMTHVSNKGCPVPKTMQIQTKQVTGDRCDIIPLADMKLKTEWKCKTGVKIPWSHSTSATDPVNDSLLDHRTLCQHWGLTTLHCCFIKSKPTVCSALLYSFSTSGSDTLLNPLAWKQDQCWFLTWLFVWYQL